MRKPMRRPRLLGSGMHMSSGFLLLTTAPGRESHVLDLLARVPGVTQRSVVYPAAIAVKVEAAGGIDPVAQRLAALDGVLASRVYRARFT